MIPEIERKAVLTLLPYLSKDPVIVDVGSNKGTWADILVREAKEMHLFEPNEILLHYTMAKYDYLRNVHYHEVAIREHGSADDRDFFYFTNDNNGLSSLYDNPKWDNLPKKTKQVKTSCLDIVFDADVIDNNVTIDILKIDTEGADLDVLKGASILLKHKQIKFIQVEKSEHIKLAGYTFDDIVDYMTSKDYHAYYFNGTKFEHFRNQDAENIYFMSQLFTQNWNSEFIKNTKGLKVQTALEIGCFEGLTTTYICDNLLTEDGRVICIDPLTDEYLPGHKDNPMFVGQYERFIRNTAGKPVELIRKKSEDAYAQIKDLRFGLIYIDGDHTEEGVFRDAVMYWNLLLDSPPELGGYMLFDDYGQSEETKRGIDRFLESQEGNYHILVKDYQVLIRRRW